MSDSIGICDSCGVDGNRTPTVLGEAVVMRRLTGVFGGLLHVYLVAAFVAVGMYWMFVVLSNEAIRARGGLWLLPAPFLLAAISHFAIKWVRRKSNAEGNGEA